jgi:hypothetical protein
VAVFFVKEYAASCWLIGRLRKTEPFSSSTMCNPTVRVESLQQTVSDDANLLEVTTFLVSQMLTKPDGALYAKWDAERSEAIWYYSADHTAIFEWPDQKEPILRQTSRGNFRSVIFRLGFRAAEEHNYVPLCGYYFLEHVNNGTLTRKKVMVHADFFPEFGVWIKATFLTVNDNADGAPATGQPTFVEVN